jgi:tetratricopeptide (TPR) repeat protein
VAAESRAALVAATGDEYRLVRVRAAGALAGYARELLGQEDRRRLEGALAELEGSFEARPDDWSAHYNRGGYYADQNQLERALGAYELASRLRPGAIPPLVNASLIYARMGETARAARALARALALDGNNAAANFNMGLLQAELGEVKKAEGHLRAALKADGNFAEAAYNLGVLVAGERPTEGLDLLRKAYVLRAEEAKYGYTLAFYLNANGNRAGAVELLRGVLARQPAHVDSWMLLGAIYEEQGQLEQAREVYRQALSGGRLSGRERQRVEGKLREVEGR